MEPMQTLYDYLRTYSHELGRRIVETYRPCMLPPIRPPRSWGV